MSECLQFVEEKVSKELGTISLQGAVPGLAMCEARSPLPDEAVQTSLYPAVRHSSILKHHFSQAFSQTFSDRYVAHVSTSLQSSSSRSALRT